MADLSEISISNFLTLYGGQVLNAYNETSRLKGRLMNRTIQSGKAADFPTFTASSSKLHTPGEDITGTVTGENASTVTSGTKTITIDKLLYDAHEVNDLADLKAHYDIHGNLSMASGAAMATTHDAWLLAAMANAATSSVVQTSTAAFSATAKFATITELLAMIESSAAKLDLLNVPASERCMVVRPYEFYQILNSDAALSSDFNSSGDRAKGQQSFSYMGFEFLSMKTQADFSGKNAAAQIAAAAPLYFGGVAATTDHSFNGALWYATAFHKSAAATLTLKGLTSEANYQPEKFNHLLTTRTAIGVGPLRPDAVVLITADN